MFHCLFSRTATPYGSQQETATALHLKSSWNSLESILMSYHSLSNNVSAAAAVKQHAERSCLSLTNALGSKPETGSSPVVPHCP